MKSWPVDAIPPKILVEGFQITPADGRTVTPMERGGDKTRGSGAGQPTIIPCQLLLQLSAVVRLRRFWKEELDWANAPFRIPDPQLSGRVITDGNGTPLVDGDGQALKTKYFWIATFQTLPTERPAGGVYWRIGFDLAVH